MKRVMRIGAVLAAMLMPLAARAQHDVHTAAGSPAAVSAEVISTCLNAQQRSLLLMDAINQRSEASRQTNSAGELRAAMAEIQRALLDVRTELGRCAALEQAAATPAPAAGPAAPAAPNAPSGSSLPRAAAPPAAADPHAGHLTPTPPVAPATKPTGRAPADPHAGHAMPNVPAAPSAKPPAARAAAPSSPAAKPAPAAADPHAGHATPAAPAAAAAKPAAEAARQTDLVEDPVSKTNVDPKTALRVLYQGKMYYFRSDTERREFMKHPGKYVSAK